MRQPRKEARKKNLSGTLRGNPANCVRRLLSGILPKKLKSAGSWHWLKSPVGEVIMPLHAWPNWRPDCLVENLKEIRNYSAGCGAEREVLSHRRKKEQQRNKKQTEKNPRKLHSRQVPCPAGREKRRLPCCSRRARRRRQEQQSLCRNQSGKARRKPGRMPVRRQSLPPQCAAAAALLLCAAKKKA